MSHSPDPGTPELYWDEVEEGAECTSPEYEVTEARVIGRVSYTP